MAEQDTVRLLRECDAGVQMGVASIDEVLDCVQADALRQRLTDSKRDHEKLDSELRSMLAQYRDDGKPPKPMAKGMSWLKTNVMLAVDKSDATVADLMTDGCNMGVKSLNRYLNQYAAADAASKNITQRLASLEETLAVDLRPYL